MANPWRTERLVFRAIEVEDEAFLSTISNDPEAYMNAAPFVPIPQGKTSATGFREFLNKQLMAALICLPAPEDEASAEEEEKKAEKKEEANRPIPIGIVNLNAEDPRLLHHRRSEIGVSIIRKYQGKGYGTEAIQWAARFGFTRFNLHRVAICAFAYNTGACKLYERLGFKPEARLRDFLWHDGRYWDFMGFAILENEWRELYDKK